MTRSARITSPFGDGVYDFRLDIGGLEELQEKADAGPEEVYQMIADGRWRVAHIREPIRIGLVRAGMDPMRALALVSRYAAEGYLVSLKALAMSILAAALVGAPDEDEPSGEMQGESDRSPDESSGSQTSTPSAAPSASRRKKSAKAASGN